MKDLKTIMEKKDDNKGDMKKTAKMSVLKHLRQMASEMMGDDLKGGIEGMKKVTVAAPDEESLEKGLDKAKDLVGEMPDLDEESAEEMEESEDEMTPEAIEEKIAELMALKAKLKS